MNVTMAQRLCQWLRTHLFLISCTLVAIPFLLSRIAFFLFPIPFLQPDSLSYYQCVWQMDQWQWPDFSMRPVGYPLFLKIVFSICNTWTAVLVAQNLFTLASAMVMVYAVYRCWRSLAPLAAIAMAAFTTSLHHFYLDIAIISDSLYSSCLVMVFALLLLALQSRKSALFALCSCCMGMAILIRTAGLFLVVTAVLVCIHLALAKYPRKAILALITPMLVLLLAAAGYNGLRSGIFTLSPFRDVYTMLATATYWEQDPQLPAEINHMIADIRSDIPAKERQTISNSWNPEALYAAFLHDYPPPVDYHHNYKTMRLVYRRMTTIAIKSHPKIYCKFVFAMAYNYLISNMCERENFLPELLPKGYSNLYINKQFAARPDNDLRRTFLKEYYAISPPKIVTWRENGRIYQYFEPPSLAKMSFDFYASWSVYVSIHNFLFHNLLWVIFCFVMLLISSWRLLCSKFIHCGDFFLFITTTAVLGSALVVALVNVSIWRFSFPMEFLYYLCPLLTPVLWDIKQEQQLANG